MLEHFDAYAQGLGRLQGEPARPFSVVHEDTGTDFCLHILRLRRPDASLGVRNATDAAKSLVDEINSIIDSIDAELVGEGCPESMHS